MKLLAFVGACLAAGLLAATPVHAEQEEIVGTMELLDDAFKGLRKATGPEGVKLARDAQASVLKALTLIPEMAAKMPEGPAKELALVDYRRLLGLVYLKFLEIEKAHLEGKPEAVEALRDQLDELRKEGHRSHVEQD
jgi:hypothetical protein